jgi:hypothetical protein
MLLDEDEYDDLYENTVIRLLPKWVRVQSGNASEP